MLRKLTQPPVGAESTASQRSERLIAPVGLLATGFTAACCLGVTAALSIATALGATFLTRDATLKPLLIVTLLVTCAGSALTYWRHRHTVGPLLLSFVSSAWIYLLVFGLSTSHADHGGMHDHMDDLHRSTVVHQGLSTGRQALVWIGYAVLIGAQIWDVVRLFAERRQPRQLTAMTGGPQ